MLRWKLEEGPSFDVSFDAPQTTTLWSLGTSGVPTPSVYIMYLVSQEVPLTMFRRIDGAGAKDVRASNDKSHCAVDLSVFVGLVGCHIAFGAAMLP